MDMKGATLYIPLYQSASIHCVRHVYFNPLKSTFPYKGGAVYVRMYLFATDVHCNFLREW